MKKEREEILEKLRSIKQTAESDLKTNHPGYENCKVKNVIHYSKKVELINKRTKEKEVFDLCTVVVEDPDTKRESIMYYLNGQEVDFAEIIIEYESPEPIKDIVDQTEENKQKPKEEQEEELVTEDLEQLEAEKEQEEKGATKSKKKDASKTDLTGKKPKYVIQTIDVDKAYIDNWTTVSRGFDLPPEVKQIAIASPMQKDDHILSSGITMYMLDNRGNIIESINGKTIADFFEVDDATGNNPMYDDNTKLELEGYAERNVGQTMRRFRSKEDPDLYLSVEQKEVGGYHEVYAGGRTMDGNDPVEVQLETRNVEIQTDLEMQEIISGYKGMYNKDEMDYEADVHDAHGDDEERTPIEHADGDERTIVFRCKYIPGTEKTWEELAEETGENIQELQERFVRELKEGKKPESILEEIEYDYEMVGPNRERR